MATFTLINDWLENMVEVANCGSDQFIVALSNTAPGAEGTPPTGDGAGVLANVTQCSYTNCSSRNITTTSSSQTGGAYALVLQDLTLTASGGTVGPLRYVYVADDTPSSPADPLACYYDYGSSITLADGETLLVDFAAGGLFTVS